MRKFSGEKLKAARLAAGFTATEFAFEVYVEARSVWSWERGIRTPQIERLPVMAQALDITIEDLFEEVPNEA